MKDAGLLCRPRVSNGGVGREERSLEWLGHENVGAPTFKVILEVRLGITKSQNGNLLEVIA